MPEISPSNTYGNCTDVCCQPVRKPMPKDPYFLHPGEGYPRLSFMDKDYSPLEFAFRGKNGKKAKEIGYVDRRDMKPISKPQIATAAAAPPASPQSPPSDTSTRSGESWGDDLSLSETASSQPKPTNDSQEDDNHIAPPVAHPMLRAVLGVPQRPAKAAVPTRKFSPLPLHAAVAIPNKQQDKSNFYSEVAPTGDTGAWDSEPANEGWGDIFAKPEVPKKTSPKAVAATSRWDALKSAASAKSEAKKPAANPQPSYALPRGIHTVYVAFVPLETTVKAIFTVFRKFGRIACLRTVETPAGDGYFGFVDFYEYDDAAKAVHHPWWDEKHFGRRSPLKVEWSMSKTKGPADPKGVSQHFGAWEEELGYA
ncbi:hypothetical protein HDV00_012693 [Rhizophlyctis rosea]|nr:hypothetical protein HDV00_012693 [Rhizophlyctis rosea]